MKSSPISLISIGIAVIAIAIAVTSLTVMQEQSSKIDILSDEITKLQSEKSQISGRGTISQQSISKMMVSEPNMITSNSQQPTMTDFEKRLAGLEKNIDELKLSLALPDSQN